MTFSRQQGNYRNETCIAIISDAFCSGRVVARPLLLLHQFKQSKFMIRTLPALSNSPLWDSSIASDVIANFTPFVASDKSATALTQQPQQNP